MISKNWMSTSSRESLSQKKAILYIFIHLLYNFFMFSIIIRKGFEGFEVFFGMKSTLAKKNNYKHFFYILEYFLFYLLPFFQTCYLIFHTQKAATHCKEQNKKRIMTIG